MNNEIDNKQLMSIYGGETVSGNLINAFTSGIKAVLEVGRSFGTSLRRIIYGNLCRI